MQKLKSSNVAIDKNLKSAKDEYTKESLKAKELQKKRAAIIGNISLLLAFIYDPMFLISKFI